MNNPIFFGSFCETTVVYCDFFEILRGKLARGRAKLISMGLSLSSMFVLFDLGSYLSLQSRTLTEQFFEGYRDAVVDGKASTAISVRFCFYSSAVFSCLVDRMEL